MDPLTAIGLASNIISFVDFGATVLNTAWEIYNSTSGDTASNRSYESVAQQMEIFAGDFLVPDALSGKDKALCVLAQECRDLATQILKLLQKSKPKDPKSKWQASWSAIKSQKYDKERSNLQQRLDNCRDQLTLQLNEKSCSEIRKNLDALVSTSQKDSNRVMQLQQQVEELRQSLEKAHSRDSQNHIQQLLQLSEDSFHALVSQRLIESLAFDDMYGRFDTIAKAHYNTFRWIFYGDTNSDNPAGDEDEITRSIMKHSYDERQDAYRASARDSFLSWLSSDHGIFHICGKLGSGKSTLMKFLCKDPRTNEVLKQWAGDRTLVIASFFFWKPGSKLQKSMDGLLRALLYETLKSLPGLVPKVLPEQWTAICSTPWQMHAKLELRSETVREAFDRLMDSHLGNLSICFFIDGLDEYEQTLQEDNLSLIKRLDSWCGKMAGNIKLCVSSREYNVFMNHLPRERRIRMQELTDKDIKLYIRDKIEFAASPEQAQHLVNSIASKADGIFLWVALVVQRARELHENSASSEEILDEVGQLPPGLEELFNHILESLEPSDRKRAYQTFAMMRRLEREGETLPLLGYAFIDDYNAMTQRASTSLSASNWETKPVETLMAQALKKLRGYCKGLVEPASAYRDAPDPWTWDKLQFCHRSIPEFLESRMRGDGMKYLQSFKEEDALSWLLLAYAQKYNPKTPYERQQLAHLSYIMTKLRHEAKLINEPFHFEKQLEAVLARQGLAMEVPEDGYGCIGLRISPVLPTFIMDLSIADTADEYTVSTPCLISCLLGNSTYLRWKLDRSPAIIDESELTLIFFILYKSVALPDPERRLLFKQLSDCGFSPQSMTRSGSRDTTRSDMTSTEPTVWEHFMVDILSQIRPGTTPGESTSTFLELFLEAGADAYIAFYTSGQADAEYATLIRGKERHRLEIPGRIFNSSSGLISPDNYPGPDVNGVLITLIDIIKLGGFGNGEKLIALAKRNMRIQGGSDNSNVPDASSNVLPPESDNLGQSRETETPIGKNAGGMVLAQARPSNGERGLSRRSLLISLLGLLSAVLIVRLSAMSE